MERNENYFSSSRKRRNPEDPESQFDAMKQEIEKLKDLIKQQKNLIGEQALTIYQLKEENDSRLVEIDDTDDKVVEEELRSKNSELEQKLEDEKMKFEKELANLKDQIINLEKQNQSKNEKIKDFDEQLSTILSIKSDPDYSTEAMQSKINELESSCDKKVKELEAQLQISEEERKLLQARSTYMEMKIEDLEAQLESKTNIETSLRTKIAEMKQDFDSETDISKAKNSQLKLNVENLTKKISEQTNAATVLINKIKELNGTIIVAKEKKEQQKSKIEKLNKEICLKNSELEQRIEEHRNLRTIANAQQEQTDSLLKFVTVDEVRDGDKLSIDRLCCKNIVVVKVSKFLFRYETCYLSTSANSVQFNLNSRKSCFQFQITDELKIESHYVNELIPLIHSCTLTKFDSSSHPIKFEEFLKFVSSHTIKIFHGGLIVKIDGFNTVFLGIHEIMRELPNVEICEIKHVERAEDCQKLVELPIFSNLQKFKCDISNPFFELSNFDGGKNKHPNVEFIFEIKLTGPSFDSGGFADFIKKHPTARFFFKIGNLRRDEKKKMLTNLIEFRKLIPPNCKVSFEY